MYIILEHANAHPTVELYLPSDSLSFCLSLKVMTADVFFCCCMVETCWYWFLLSPLLSVASLQVKQTIFDPDLSLLFRIGLNPLAQSFIFSTCIYALGISSSSLYSSRFSVLIYRYFPLKLKTNCGILDRELHDGAGFLWVAPHFVSRGWKCTPAQT